MVLGQVHELESASSDAPNHPPLVEHLEDEGE